ncbi:hypothetical protein ACFFGH_31455 [Lysobacter korlensis]|uniref:Lipoprotein n=1 Tax=Lysobacter korlensis TaxID=553636 RepID=A0ABV6RZG5_9GAMM
MNRLLPGAPAALVTLLLCAGCAAGPSSAPSEPTRAASPSAAPETPTPPAPAPEEPTVTGADVTASALSTVMSDGTTGDGFSYWEPAQAVVEELTEAFGAPPAIADREAVGHTPPLTEYAWDGARILDWDGEVGTFSPDWAVHVDQAVVHRLEITTIDGIKAGDSALELEESYPELSWRSTPTGFPERIDLRLGSVPIELTEKEWDASGIPRIGEWVEGYDGPKETSFAVFVTATGPDWGVSFTAPALNFGP